MRIRNLANTLYFKERSSRLSFFLPFFVRSYYKVPGKQRNKLNTVGSECF